MRVSESGVFDEIRKLQVNKGPKKGDKPQDTKQSEADKVAEENNRSFSIAALNDRSFEVNLSKVEQLKQEIEEGNYKPNTEIIAKELLKGETKGDFNLGLFS